MSNRGEWYYTAHLEALGQRRGDPLGFRAIADRIADELVPDLSNGTQDGRWLSIVCWILRRVQPFVRDRGSSMEERAEAYDWIRPAELLWVAAALHQDETTGTGESPARDLPQRQAVGRWRKNSQLPRMGLSGEAWLRYRFAGPYGAWRTVLRTLGITAPDGLTLVEGDIGEQLSKTLDELLGQKGFRKCEPFVNKVAKKEPLDAWANKFNWKKVPSSALPTDRKLPSKLEEANLLRKLFFEPTSITSIMRTKVLERMKSQKLRKLRKLDHASMVGRLAKECASIQHVREFTLFCDAAIEAIAKILDEAKNQKAQDQRVLYSSVTSASTVKEALKTLRLTALGWSRLSSDKVRYPGVSELAKKMESKDRKRAIQELIEHHEEHHGGRLWLERADSSHFRVVGDAGAPRPYSYRLWSLCRLGVQAGCLKSDHIPDALLDRRPSEDDDE